MFISKIKNKTKHKPKNLVNRTKPKNDSTKKYKQTHTVYVFSSYVIIHNSFIKFINILIHRNKRINLKYIVLKANKNMI